MSKEEREKQIPHWAREPNTGLFPGLWDHDLSWRQTLNQLSHSGAPRPFAFNVIINMFEFKSIFIPCSYYLYFLFFVPPFLPSFVLFEHFQCLILIFLSLFFYHTSLFSFLLVALEITVCILNFYSLLRINSLALQVKSRNLGYFYPPSSMLSLFYMLYLHTLKTPSDNGIIFALKH